MGCAHTADNYTVSADNSKRTGYIRDYGKLALLWVCIGFAFFVGSGV